MDYNNEQNNDFLNLSLQNEERNDLLDLTPPTEEKNDFLNDFSAVETVQKKKRKLPIMIVTLVLIAIVAVVVWGFNSDLFASKGKKFAKLLTTDQVMFSNIKENIKNMQLNTKLEVDIDEIMEDMGEDPTGIGSLKLESKEITKNEDYSSSFVFSAEGIKDGKLELQVAKTDNLVGINIPNITEKFIGIDLDDLEGLKENLEDLGIELSMESDLEGLTEKDIEDLMKFLEKYVNVMLEDISKYIETESNVELESDGNKTKATEYTLKIDGEVMANVSFKVLKELNKNKKDIDKLVELEIIEDKEQFIEDLEAAIKEIEEIIKEEDYDSILDDDIIIKLYEKNGKNIATVIGIADTEMGLYFFENTKKESVCLFEIANDDESIFIILEMKEEKNVTESKLKLKVDMDAEEHELILCEMEVEELSDIKDEMIKIDKDDILLLNDATEDDLEEYANDVVKNVEELMESVGLLDSVESETLEEFEDDFLEVDDNLNEEKIETVNVSKGHLLIVQNMYNKVECGMSKDEVIAKIGKPTKMDENSYSGALYMMYEDEAENELLEVVLMDGKVYEKSIELYSSKYSNISLAKELDTEIEDLNSLISKVKEDMTLKEVENILGKKYFQKWADEYGYTSYTWYDKKDNRVTISFDDDEKAYYVGMILQMW